MTALLEFDFLRRAVIAAALVGLAAPAVGTFIVQRRLALLGDGIGHVALTGVALGFLTGTSPILTAVAASILGAAAIEILRERGRTSGDVALALLFYGGIAGGVLLIGLAPGGSSANLLSYLFGSVSSVSATDLYVVAGLAVAVLFVVALFGRELFVLCQDAEIARVSGLPVRFLSLLVAVTAAVTVVIAMRVVGLLLVSAMMVVPVAAAQRVMRGFRATMLVAMVIGVLTSVGGLSGAFYADVAPGAAIVLLALAAFIVALAAGRAVRGRARTPPEAGDPGTTRTLREHENVSHPT